jgi:preprotein translocase subunit SecE
MKSTPKGPGTPARATPSNRPANRSAAGRPAAAAAGGARAANARATQEFFRGIVSEMRRVTWPSREEWVAATILTVVLVVGVGVFTYLVDLAFGGIFSLLTGGAR